MSYIARHLPKMASMVAAVAITFCVQGLRFAGVDQLARESQASADSSQIAADRTPGGVVHAQG